MIGTTYMFVKKNIFLDSSVIYSSDGDKLSEYFVFLTSGLLQWNP